MLLNHSAARLAPAHRADAPWLPAVVAAPCRAPASPLIAGVPRGSSNSKHAVSQSSRRQQERDVAARAHSAIPPAQGLFDPANDRDSCELELGKAAHKSVKDTVTCRPALFAFAPCAMNATYDQWCADVCRMDAMRRCQAKGKVHVGRDADCSSDCASVCFVQSTRSPSPG
jgi:hypothetical protein